MEIYRTEFFVPVNRETKTFEQHEKESFQILEQSLKKRTFNFDDNWYKDMFSRIEIRSTHWDDEMRKMRQEFFRLTAGDDYDDHFSSSNNTTTRTQTTIISSQKTNQPVSNELAPHGQRSITEQRSTQQIKTHFERESDGLVHFKTHFDVTGYKPEDIKVTVKNKRLYISAKHEVKTATSMSYKEFSRSFDLPGNIDEKLMICTLTNDGVLMINAPVDSPEYNKSIEFNCKTEVLPIMDAAVPQQSTVVSCNTATQALQIIGKTGTSIITVSGIKKLHLEVEIQDDYTDEEIKVEFRNQTIHIYGRHEEKSGNRSAWKEFQKEFGILETIRTTTITKKLIHRTLVIEADVA